MDAARLGAVNMVAMGSPTRTERENEARRLLDGQGFKLGQVPNEPDPTTVPSKATALVLDESGGVPVSQRAGVAASLAGLVGSTAQPGGVFRSAGNGAAPCTSTTGSASGSLAGGTGVKRIRTVAAVNELRVLWGNFTVGGVESSAYGDTTIVAATIEYPAGTFTPIFFNGDTSKVMKGGGIVESDSVFVTIPANTDFWVRTYATWTAGQTIVLGNIYPTNGQSGSNSATPTDRTQQAGSVGGDTLAPCPCAVRARTTSGADCIAIVGDSIANGTGDYPDQGRGYTYLATDGVILTQKVSAPTARAVYDVTQATRWRKFRLLPGCTAAYEAYGINDLANGRTLAQLKADKITLWQSLRAVVGIDKLLAGTLVPFTTSTDGWTTGGSQAVSAYEASRTGYNDWVRDGAPINSADMTAAAVGATSGVIRAGDTGHPLTGACVDVADTVEADATNTQTRNGGRWLVPALRTVADAAITSGSKTLTSATAAFTAADVGKTVTIAGAGTSGALKVDTIQAYTNATTVSVTTNAGTTVSGAALKIGGPTGDGTHPSTPSHAAMAAALTAGLPRLRRS